MNILEMFPNKFIIDPITNCWLFTGYLDEKGYGKIRYLTYHVVSVHRLSAFLSNIIIDLGDSKIHALHKLECPNKHCANPEHLYAGDNFDNQRDRALSGYINPKSFQTHCKYGHPLSGDNLYIPKDGRRRCKICRQRNAKKHDSTRVIW